MPGIGPGTWEDVSERLNLSVRTLAIGTGRIHGRLDHVYRFDLLPLFPEEFPPEGRETFRAIMVDLGRLEDLSEDDGMMLAIRIIESRHQAESGADLELERA
jgi:hypothetical protein